METKQCRAECKRVLPLSAFGVNKKYKSGKHNYCSDCCRNKVNAHRAGWMLPTELPVRKVAIEQMRLPLDQLVLLAVRGGAHTKYAIGRKVKKSPELVDQVLAELILDKRQIVTKTVGEEREYFLAA